MKPPPSEPILDVELSDTLASAIAPVDLSSQERDRMRARILKRASTLPPSRMSTLRGTEGVWKDFVPGIQDQNTVR